MSTSPPNSAGNHGFPGSAASIASSNLTYASYCRPHEADGALGKNTYHYQPLQDMQFRLVEIFPKRQTMIKCRIVHESLESPPPYLAISYTWGDINNTKMLEIGGSSLPVGVNLWGALWALRQKDASIFVWVDALCIDQSNRDEKAQQVPLMAMIYSNAEIVAIWLGTDEDDSARAIDFLDTLSTKGSSIEEFSNLVESEAGKSNIAAVVSLFERSYWTRLWVVQEILHAKDIMVYCGSKNVPWSVYTRASDIFSQYKRQIEYYFPGGQRDTRRHSLSLNQFSYSQVLAYEGPRSFLDLKSFLNSGDASLLKVLRACRSKLSSEPKDKLFGILGISAEARKDFPPDYNQSVKDVYTQIVDTLIETTDSLDVICDAIHFPIHTSSANLPSFVPDWSHIPQTSAMGQQYQFSASGGRKAICKFDDRLTKLTISAIYLDTIDKHGIAVGTLCTLADYLMAFLHWRALLLGETEDYKYEESLRVQEEFCSALSLGQIPKKYERPIEWLTACYHIFAAMLNKRLPRLLLDNDLEKYINAKVDIKPEDRRQFLQDHFGSRMMGRCFCRTKGGRIGMGSGVMLPGDIIVVPLGCSTPILLRKEGANGEYRFIGDVFVNRWMTGRAIDELNEKKRQVEEFVLH
ncbi:heterokaryon incompatibility protein-domain-containing protein [Amylocarpus encephaloides]|uniref:Heterokaryon incompatibility protein-domain-containing protein n=1 Tax=Amylocarpus encephaloides TaxID=45428 RepID=A0A9P8C5I6_9HELO|nr:heterokaryon incompatibility protein-domain-containing protein [Amylocarpus encephaloides]